MGAAAVSQRMAARQYRSLAVCTVLAALVAWLAGVENTYVSGQNIAIDGGFTRV